jgi:hypothetical protein
MNVFERLITIEDVERITKKRLRARTLRKLAREGLFPVVRIGRRIFVDLAEVEAYTKAGGQALPGGWRRNPKAQSTGPQEDTDLTLKLNSQQGTYDAE